MKNVFLKKSNLFALVFLFLLFFSCTKEKKIVENNNLKKYNVNSGLLNEIYSKYDNMLQKVFKSKEELKKTLEILSKEYNIDFLESNSLKELDSKMQKTLLRKEHTERSDLKSNNDNILFDDLYINQEIESYSLDNKTPILLGLTYKKMNEMVKKSKKYLQKKQFIALVSDRPIYPEDFANRNELKKALVFKTKKFAKHKNKINKIYDTYTKNNDHPILKKASFYIKLIQLLNPKVAEEGNVVFSKLKSSLEENGIDNSKTKDLIIEMRDFIYNIAVKKYIPTEADMVKMIIQDNSLSKSTIIETKTKYKIQDRATTEDTYEDLLKYIQENNSHTKNYILIGLKPFIYRQWLQLELMSSKTFGNSFNQSTIDYVAINGKVKINNNIFADELARLIHVLTIYS